MRQKLIRVRELSVGRERFVKLVFLIIRETNSAGIRLQVDACNVKPTEDLSGIFALDGFLEA